MQDEAAARGSDEGRMVDAESRHAGDDVPGFGGDVVVFSSWGRSPDWPRPR